MTNEARNVKIGTLVSLAAAPQKLGTVVDGKVDDHGRVWVRWDEFGSTKVAVDHLILVEAT